MAQRLDTMYPAIARWVMEYGWIELGQDDMSRSFVRALDAGGLVWEGQEHYETLDDTVQDLEAELTAWIQHNL
jgi:hypothetical protein